MRLELTLPALERLIAGDNDLELHLKKQIIQEFAKRHLKEVAETATYEAAIAATKTFVDAAAKEAFNIENLTGTQWPTVGYRIKSMIETLVNDSAQKAVDEALAKILQYQKHYWSKYIEEAVKKGVDRQIEEEIKEGIQKRLEAASREV